VVVVEDITKPFKRRKGDEAIALRWRRRPDDHAWHACGCGGGGIGVRPVADHQHL
jgi:hypothetical protein